MAEQSVLVLSLSPIQRDARVLRQIESLRARGFRVSVAGYGTLDSSVSADVKMYTIRRPPDSIWRKLRTGLALVSARMLPSVGYALWSRWRAEYQYARGLLAGASFDLIIANDWHALPLVPTVNSSGTRIVLDLHEYSPKQFDNRTLWRLLVAPLIDYVLRTQTSDVSAFITVNDVIAEEYQKNYGFDCAVVRNIPSRDTTPQFRATDPDRVRMVHHGVYNKERELERMVQAIALCDTRFDLTFMLVNDGSVEVERFKKFADSVAGGRVKFLPPVPPGKIISVISGFDMGFYVLPPVTLNHRFALPNKFFDFMGAGLAVCVGPTVEMASLATHYGFGVVSPSFDPEDAAKTLNSLSAESIDTMKAKAIAAAGELNAVTEMKKFLGAAIPSTEVSRN